MEIKQSFRKTGVFHIDGKTYSLQEITFAQLRVHYGTGRSLLISGTGRDKKYEYRVGCMTDIGDIEISQWVELVRYLIERDGEEQLQEKLLDWVKRSCIWLHTRKEQEEHALSLHASRIFECKEWVDYEAFNKHYYPEILPGTKEGAIQNE